MRNMKAAVFTAPGRIVLAITPCGQCHSCLDGHHSQCGGQAMGNLILGSVATKVIHLVDVPVTLVK